MRKSVAQKSPKGGKQKGLKKLVRKRAKAGGSPGRVRSTRSIPDDMVLAPQAEVPRELAALERTRRSRVRELSWMQFDRLVHEMAKTIRKRFEPEAVVGVAHGGVFVGGAIASALSVEFFPVRISRRSRDKGHVEKKPRLMGEMPKELRGLRVLVVDDIASSGDTLELAKALLAKVGAAEVATACLVSKEEGYRPDFQALATDDLVVFPWDYDMVNDARFSPAGRG